MRGPELDQHAFEVLSFLMNRFLDRLWGVTRWVDSDMFKDFGFDGLECLGDPLNTRAFRPKLQVFETFGF